MAWLAHKPTENISLTRARSILVHFIILLVCFLALAPMLWLIGRADIAGLKRVLLDSSWRDAIVNSIFLASIQAVVSTLLAGMMGFAMAKHDFFGRKIVLMGLVFTMLVPAQLLMPGAFEMVMKTGLFDTRLAAIFPGLFSVFGSLLMMQAIARVPDETLHAARLDGCNELRVWWDIVMPQIIPTTTTLAVLSFAAAWNALLWPSLILASESKATAAMWAANVAFNASSGELSDTSFIAAAVLLTMSPVLLLGLLHTNDD